MLENAFKIVLDPVYPPPNNNKKYFSWLCDLSFKNKFELIFSEFAYEKNIK